MTSSDDHSPDDPNSPKHQELAGIPGLDFQNATSDDGVPALDGMPEFNAPFEAPSVAPSGETDSDPHPASPIPASAPDASSGPMDAVKTFSENIQIASAPVEAAYPFSLKIDGKLSAWEREKLLDLLAAENMGIREVDLEPQFQAGRILIPRISEFAGVLLVQALRGTAAEMTLGPSDLVFSTEDTREDLSLPQTGASGRYTYVTPGAETSDSHPADRIPIVIEAEVPGQPVFEVLDLVTASAALSLQAVEAEKSPQYQDALEALQRELRYKAHRKGANAIVNFTAKLEFLRLASQYRLTAMGSAIRY